jgi:hypothetical protein
MRGAFDYIEEELRFNHGGNSNLTRLQLWTNTVVESRHLRQCLTEPAVVGNSQKQKSVEVLAKYIVGIYKARFVTASTATNRQRSTDSRQMIVL